MIVAMKKAFLVVQNKDKDSAIRNLRRLGLLHVEHDHDPKGQEISLMHDDINLVNQAIGILGNISGNNSSVRIEGKKQKDLKSVIQYIIDLHKRYEHLKEYSVTLKGQIDQWEHWGDFDPEDIKILKKNNIYLRFYEVLKNQISDFPESIIIKKISVQGAMVNCLAISIGEPEIGFKEVEPPKSSLSAMRERLKQDTLALEAIQDSLLGHLVYSDDLLALKKSLRKDLEFYEALYGMGEEEGLTYLKGYIPFDAEPKLLSAAKKEGWGILIKTPSDDDNVPTLMRNPAWVSLIRPVLKLLEIIPGYRELDISPVFLIFFSLFFGVLIGDAGYGLVYLFLTIFAHKRLGGKVKNKGVFFLFYLLSSCAIIWGLLIGSFFGQEWLLSAGFKPLAPSLNNVSFIQAFCFLIGAVHLSIAHSWRAVLKSPSLSALSDAGWISIIWAAFFIAKALLLGDAFPGFGKWLIISGLTLVMLFTNPQRNLLKAVGEGLGTIALSLVNNFTDIVSYVRLFAVGLASVAIADAFNSMASSVGSGGTIAAVIMGVFILIAGHGLNIILGPMSVLVHGVRLNVLEFSSHANVTWSGVEYKPLNEKINNVADV
jgi:V/A-type H+-transporting ATPase subunit I